MDFRKKYRKTPKSTTAEKTKKGVVEENFLKSDYDIKSKKQVNPS